MADQIYLLDKSGAGNGNCLIHSYLHQLLFAAAFGIKQQFIILFIYEGHRDHKRKACFLAVYNFFVADFPGFIQLKIRRSLLISWGVSAAVQRKK